MIILFAVAVILYIIYILGCIIDRSVYKKETYHRFSKLDYFKKSLAIPFYDWYVSLKNLFNED